MNYGIRQAHRFNEEVVLGNSLQDMSPENQAKMILKYGKLVKGWSHILLLIENVLRQGALSKRPRGGYTPETLSAKIEEKVNTIADQEVTDISKPLIEMLKKSAGGFDPDLIQEMRKILNQLYWNIEKRRRYNLTMRQVMEYWREHAVADDRRYYIRIMKPSDI